MRISAGLLVLQNANLDVHGFYSRPISVIQREDVPPKRFHKLDHFNLLQLVKTIGHENRNFLRRVALICLEVQEKGKFAHSRLLQELNVDLMRLLSI